MGRRTSHSGWPTRAKPKTIFVDRLRRAGILASAHSSYGTIRYRNTLSCDATKNRTNRENGLKIARSINRFLTRVLNV